MWIENLIVEHCRLLNKVELKFSPHLNVIVGDNASGKTSLLEALSLLSSGRSFRTSHVSDVISYNSESILVSAKIQSDKDSAQIGIQKNKTKTKIRINQQNVFSQAELSLHLPITVIHPGSIDLITGSPKLRRAYLDWIAFYLYPDFHKKWKTYQHILKQRNICLKDRKHRQSLDKWTHELIELQPQINDYRVSALQSLKTSWLETTDKLFSNIEFDLEFKSGFPDNIKLDKESLSKYYSDREDYDLRIQRTSGGVHRADFRLIMNDKPAVDIASRGQLKLLAISLLLAQSSSINNNFSEKGILLIDDLAAELDNQNKEKLLDYLGTLNQQLIVTMTKLSKIPVLDHKVFHVKHGSFSEFSDD